MKYTISIQIDQPREQVAKLFENPDNIAKWQRGFVSMQVKEGEPGAVGSKTRTRKKAVFIVLSLLKWFSPWELVG